MAKSKKDKAREKKQKEWEKWEKSFSDFHKKGPFIKRVFRSRGVTLPFYDYYDSYVTEFEKIVAEAKQRFSSLIGVFEVDDETYYGTDRSRWTPDMDQIFWNMDGAPGYGSLDERESNVNGYMNAFLTKTGELKTLVLIRKTVPSDNNHREFKYALKLIAVLHELGHVKDVEEGINFNRHTKDCQILEAEAFAHLYCAEQMAAKNYYQSYSMFFDSLNKYVNASDYRATVSKLVLERMPDYKLLDINTVPLSPLTEADLESLGPDGRRAFGLAG